MESSASRDFEEKTTFTNKPEWMGMLCMNQQKVKTILGAQSACVCEELYHKWAKWVFDLNI